MTVFSPFVLLSVVKEEIFGDSTPLPLFNNSIVCWLELAGASGSQVSSSVASSSDASNGQKKKKRQPMTQEEIDGSDVMTLPERGPGVGETRPPSFQ